MHHLAAACSQTSLTAGTRDELVLRCREHNKMADALSNEALDGVGWGGGLKLPNVSSGGCSFACWSPPQKPAVCTNTNLHPRSFAASSLA